MEIIIVCTDIDEITRKEEVHEAFEKQVDAISGENVKEILWWSTNRHRKPIIGGSTQTVSNTASENRLGFVSY